MLSFPHLSIPESHVLPILRTEQKAASIAKIVT